MLDYIFGDHIDTTKTGPLTVKGLKLDPQGYSVEVYATTLDTHSLYALGRFKNNPNDSISFTPNRNFARLVNSQETYMAKMPYLSAETRCRFKWQYVDGKMQFHLNHGIEGWQLLDEVECPDPVFDANYMFGSKTNCLSPRVVIRDHKEEITNDFTVVDGQFTDTVGNATVEEVLNNGITTVHAITQIEGDGKLPLGETLQFETSDGFEIEKVLLNDTLELDFKDGIKIPLGDVDHLPQLGEVTLSAIGKDGTTFTMAAELVAPEQFTVVEYTSVVTDETSLTHQVQRHPVKGNVVMYAPTDNVSVDEFNVIHPKADAVDHKFYVLDNGGMFVVHITPDQKIEEPPLGPPLNIHRDFTGFELGESVVGDTGFTSDATRATLTDEKYFAGKPAVKSSMREGQAEWAWGGVMRLPRKVGKGETVCISFPMAVPKETEILSRDNFNTKWFRCSFKDENGKKQPYADIYIRNREGDDKQFAYILEGHNKWHKFGDKNNPKDCIVQDNEFAQYMMVITLDDKSVEDGGKGRVRFYKNGHLVKGGDITNRPTMLHPTNVMDSFYLGTYWNGRVPKDQHIYLADLRIMTAAEVDAVDDEGFPVLPDLEDSSTDEGEAPVQPEPEPEEPVEPEPTPEPEPEEPVEPGPVEPEEPITEPDPIPEEPSNPLPDNPIKFEDTTIKLEVGASVTITRTEEGTELLIRKPK